MIETSESRRNVVVPVEDNELCEKALRWTVENVWRRGDVVHLVHVVATSQSNPFTSSGDQEHELQVDNARTMIQDRFVPFLDAAKVESHVSIIRGDSSSCDAIGALLCDKAESVGAALIVMAAHNKGPIVRFVVGSVTKYCLDHSTTTVLLMRES